MYKKAIYPGSFDPITKGHLDIIKRSSKLFDKIVIAVLVNYNKKNTWFTVEERIKIIQETLLIENIEAEVVAFSGLLVDFIEEQEANILIRGLRAVSDYEYELQFTLFNSELAKTNFETIFLTANRKYLYLSSSIVKEIAINNGELTNFLTDNTIKWVEEKIKRGNNGN